MKRSYSRIGPLASLSIGGALLLCISLVRAAVPTPVVTGPIPSPDVAGSPGHNYTFFATDLNFRDLGYVEEEFFISGTANVYDTPNPGGGIGAIPTAYPVANIVSTGHPYKTRIVVRRPNDPTKYNGVAILEWTNVTNNYDNEAFWYQTNDYLIRSGFAHVAVSAQAAGIDNAATGLKAWSPARYGTLDVRDGGKVTGFKEKPRGDGGLINGGFFVLSPRVGEYIGGDDSVWEREPLEGLARDGQLASYRYQGFWQPMDTLREKQIGRAHV